MLTAAVNTIFIVCSAAYFDSDRSIIPVVCVQTTVSLASRQDLRLLKRGINHVPYNSGPPLHTIFVAPVWSTVNSTITGQTARAEHLYALLFKFPPCQKPRLKAVPPRL